MEVIFSVTTFSLFSRIRISTGNTIPLLQRLLSVRGIGEDHRIVPRRLSATGRTVNFILRSILGSWRKPFKPRTIKLIALACGRFEGFAVNDPKLATMVLDDPRAL